MDSPFFKSKCLDRVVYLNDIERLSEAETASLRTELRIAVSTMQLKIKQEQETADPDWLYSVNLKREICEEFLERIKEVVDIDSSSKLNHYHLLYLRQEISDALGPTRARELFDRSRIGAVAQLRRESLL